MRIKHIFMALFMAVVIGFGSLAAAAGGKNRWASEEIDYVYQLCQYTDADEVLIEQEVGGTNTIVKVDCSDGAGAVEGENDGDSDSDNSDD